MKVQAQRIEPRNFAPFGKVVTSPEGEPTAESKEFKFWSDIANYEISGETEVGLCTVYRQPETAVTGVERHMRTPEILIPVDAPFVLPVLLEGAPEQKLGAFRVNPGEAVIINPAVWHGACLPVGAEQSSYFVIFRRGTPHEDVAKKEIAKIMLNF